LNALARVFDSVLIAGPPELGRPGLPTVPDEAPGRGPIAGLASGLRAAQTPWIFAVPCDSPFIPEAFLLGMAGLIGEEEAVVPRSGGFYEPLHALYSARCLPVLEELIESGERKILKLYERIRVRTAPEELIRGWDPAGLCFLNINTPEDLAQAEKYLAALGLKSKI
jgi:molybdopterin-guanine dinucleotide biosynthesis protein A